MVFSLYIGKYCPFFSYIYLATVFPIGGFLYISIKDTPFLFFIFAQIPYIAFPKTVFLYIVLNTLFLLIFCPDSKFLYLAYIYDIKDILFSFSSSPEFMCLFLYIYIETSFLYSVSYI